jgi:flagellar basal-body rod protein FlgB
MELSSHFGIHEQALTLRARRAEVLATNLANVDTPGFQARDIDFKDVFAEMADQGALKTTNARHMIQNAVMADTSLKYRVPLQVGLDGNTVDSAVENSQFAENNMRYLASLRFMGMKINHMLTAIKGE